ncbi:hypothetical protein [Arthrobacter sp. SW1]|uniref:hypothetical protein n=1 Tax=Arthrobacter sp. SW1 TaxID=1920889 RepID=UPI00149573CD|nr:hypothetical protein [Arthrobacter sp. SW1]
MPDLNLLVYAGTLALFVLGALAVGALSLLLFSGIALVHSARQARRRKRHGMRKE